MLVHLAKSRILPLRPTSTLQQKIDTCAANYLFPLLMACKNEVKAWITEYGNDHYMGKIFFQELYNDHKVKINFLKNTVKKYLSNQLRTHLVFRQGWLSLRLTTKGSHVICNAIWHLCSPLWSSGETYVAIFLTCIPSLLWEYCV